MEAQQHHELLELIRQLIAEQAAVKEKVEQGLSIQQAELQTAQKEIEHLQAKLRMQETVLAAKDETITLLRASFNRPN